jgi:hypothetical protein
LPQVALVSVNSVTAMPPPPPAPPPPSSPAAPGNEAKPAPKRKRPVRRMSRCRSCAPTSRRTAPCEAPCRQGLWSCTRTRAHVRTPTDPTDPPPPPFRPHTHVRIGPRSCARLWLLHGHWRSVCVWLACEASYAHARLPAAWGKGCGSAPKGCGCAPKGRGSSPARSTQFATPGPLCVARMRTVAPAFGRDSVSQCVEPTGRGPPVAAAVGGRPAVGPKPEHIAHPNYSFLSQLEGAQRGGSGYARGCTGTPRCELPRKKKLNGA